ncbi:MAG TPA: GAF domain-containing protein, partial [Bacteroidetes bacterium]|nr:GAF domain-containing protein [Bacteroidota bacterium]
VAQIMNKLKGTFTKKDLEILNAMTAQAAAAIQYNLNIEEIEASKKQELEFLELVSKVSSELEIGPLLQKIIETITTMLDADRSTLFINDEKTNELFTEVGQGLGKTTIRFPNHLGIAGTVFTSGEVINIPHAYADLRFNPSFDKQTGYFTQSILCMPVRNKQGKAIGVTQVLNKRGGAFNKEDEARLEAFVSQISVGIENAKLFDDVKNMKNYTESILASMTNAVITVDNDKVITTCNRAGLHMVQIKRSEIIGKTIEDIIKGPNAWLIEKFDDLENPVDENDLEEKNILPKYRDLEFLDTELAFNEEKVSANITIHPLLNEKDEKLGTMLMIEDISTEKRMKSTMSKYMNAELADQLLDGGDEFINGKESLGTVLFSDVRSFTTITEALGAKGTVSLLNEYFTIMVECIQSEGGMLDKFIGDAMMAIFGTPFSHDDDPDRGVRAAIEMMRELNAFNKIRSDSGLHAIDHGMGLNTDMIVSGNIGSPKRMDYTVIGDGVNLAARLESACKQYGARILVSEFTYKALKATYKSREIDKVVVKGKTKPVGVYEILDYHDEKSFPNMVDALGLFNFGFEQYKKGDWNKAMQKFKEVLKVNPKDKCSTMYLERCEYLKKLDGVWVMTSK